MTRPSTLDVIGDRERDHTRLPIVGEFADSRFQNLRNVPTLQALKLHAFMFKSAGGAVTEDRWFSAPMSDLKKIAGLRNHSRETLAELLVQLRGVVMEWDDTRTDGRRFTAIAGLLDIAEVDFDGDDGDGPAIMRWKFGEGLRRLVAQSNYWAVIDRQTAFSLSSRYSFRLFEMLSVRENLQHKAKEVFTVSDLRARLGVPDGKMTRWQDFRRYALEASIREINQLARYNVAMKPIKSGRKIVAVELSWKSKENLGETKRELAGSKVGRRARREGTVELPLKGFPSVGGIKYTPWEKIAREYGTTPLPDLGLMADAFRRWCVTKKIPLDARTIEKTFTGWVEKFEVK